MTKNQDNKTISMTNALVGKAGALTALAELDRDIALALERFGTPPERSMPRGFETLARTIVGQQISRHAATAVWQAMAAEGFDQAERVARADIDALKNAGLSRMKAEYIHGLATAITDGTLSIDEIHRMPGIEAADVLKRLRGIGDWTADNYRLFVMLDMDAWPYNDLALQEGMKILKNLSTRPNGTDMQGRGEEWRPYRGAGALMLWHVYARHRHDASPAAI